MINKYSYIIKKIEMLFDKLSTLKFHKMVSKWTIEKRIGVDVGYHNDNIHPADREGCIGKRGIDKLFTLEKVIELAYKMENKPNIIIKAGPNAKWYFKRFPKEAIETEMCKQQWRDTSRCTMYIIEWDE